MLNLLPCLVVMQIRVLCNFIFRELLTCACGWESCIRRWWPDSALQRFSETHTNVHLLLTNKHNPNVHVM